MRLTSVFSGQTGSSSDAGEFQRGSSNQGQSRVARARKRSNQLALSTTKLTPIFLPLQLMDQEGKPLLLMFLGCCMLFFLTTQTLAQSHGRHPPPANIDVGGGDDARRRVQTYIVFVKKPRHLVFSSHEDREEWHKSFLPSLTLDSGEPRLVYSYEHAINGFAARLTPDEVEAMKAMDGFLYALTDEELKPRTTYSPKFLGLNRGGQLWNHTKKAAGMVIGVLEMGFLLKHRSFRGDKMPPPPARWKGRCDYGSDFCNNKLIGARMFNSSGPYDPYGDVMHGTHVASIAAGNFVPGASHQGHAGGTAAGAAPGAHLAFYTVQGMADMVMGIDQAIRDGIDVLSISIGLSAAYPFYYDPIAIGTLSAVRRGVFVSVAAGNDGPDHGTMLDNEPWTLSVGASTMDRVVRANLQLGDGRVIPGEFAQSEYEFPPTGAVVPAVFPGGSTGNDSIKNCHDKKFGDVDVSGKIVLCLRNHLRRTIYTDRVRGCNVKDAGGKAMVLMNQKVHGSTIVYGFPCNPTVLVAYNESRRLEKYVMSARNATISIEPVGTVYGVPRNPAVADFSSRGPSPVNKGILKPDILGPGVNIVAAFTWEDRPFISFPGTSMACPHLSGIAAMLRSSHPDWSPAMVKSAIMTTAVRVDNTGAPMADETGNPADLFATGAGQVNPTRADDPGLVYDIDYPDYVKYVCGLGYSQHQMEAIVRGDLNCSAVGQMSGEELNYPSFSVSVSAIPIPKTITRTVTNVGPVTSSYMIWVEKPVDVWVDVAPSRLDFTRTRQTRSYSVTFVSANPSRRPGDNAEGQLTWTSASGNHVVRSPISVTFA